MNKYNGIIKILLLLVVCPLILWQVSFRKTVSLCQENIRVVRQVETLQRSVPMKAAMHLFPSQSAPMLSDGKLLEVLSLVLRKNKVAVSGYTPVMNDSEAKLALYTGTLVLQGRFVGLLHTIQAIEQLPNINIKIVEATFTVSQSKDRKVPPDKVTLKIVLQQLENI